MNSDNKMDLDLLHKDKGLDEETNNLGKGIEPTDEQPTITDQPKHYKQQGIIYHHTPKPYRRRCSLNVVQSVFMDLLVLTVVSVIVLLVATYLYGNVAYKPLKESKVICTTIDERAEIQDFDIFCLKYYDDNYIKAPTLNTAVIKSDGQLTITNRTSNKNPIQVEIYNDADNTLLYSTDLIPVRYKVRATPLTELPTDTNKIACTVKIYEVQDNNLLHYATYPLTIRVKR